jgi:hypothetical protein
MWIMQPELQEWANQIFGHSGAVCPSDESTLARLAEVFENAAILLNPYQDVTLNQVFWDLPATAFLGLKNENISWPIRHRLIESFEPLFRDFFAARCKPVLGHLSEEGTPLNSACYMWWDFDCWVATKHPLPQNPMDSTFLASMRSILRIGHAACQESALHGLGHWHWAHAAAVEEIIDEFLNREPGRLRDYAMAARCGCVQ